MCGIGGEGGAERLLMKDLGAGALGGIERQGLQAAAQ